MLKLIIEDDEGRKTVVPFVRDEITIGRQEGNTIRLTERNVSRQHARLMRLNGHVVVEDLGSYNGTRINGERVAGQSSLKEGDLIQIGDYDLALQTEAAANAAPSPITAKVPAPRRPDSDGALAAMRPTVPAIEALEGRQPGNEEPEEDEEESGDEPGHTPPSPAEARRHATAIIRMDQMESDRPRKVEVVPPDERPRLVVLSPTEFKGQEFDCVRTELRIGRTSENDIALDHRSLSRTHAKVVREDTGEWRVLDMQSANGLTVNGESYAQATLASGDLLELGHVKFRFLGPGEMADGGEEEGEAPRSKLPLVAAIVVLLAGGAIGGLLVMRSQGGTQPTQPPEVAQPANDPNTPPAPPEDSAPPKQAQTEPTDTKPDEQAPAPAVETAQEKLQKARAAVARKDLQAAQLILDSMRDPKGGLSKDANALAQQVTTERGYDEKLTLAQAALEGHRIPEAAKLVAETKATTLFADRHAELSALVTAAQTKPVEAPPAPAPQEKPVEAAKPPPVASATDAQVETIITEAKALIRTKQREAYEAALEQAKQCEKLAPQNPECQFLLGVTYVRLNKTNLAAKHYRQFLDMAPASDSRRAAVEKAMVGYKPTAGE
ncbi:FHA domain-containing protein [Myxococcaceae bacterium JPH2]|nr:FHA domain-containing protein [Myxococcaceae bacterium JPH2]